MSTLYFPQLEAGAIAQYPVQRMWSKRCGVDVLPDGSRVVMTGAAPARVEWTLQYSGLSDAEWGALATLFDATYGRMGAFTFLDPTANLLAWSDDLTREVWSVDPLLLVTAGQPDPMGGTNAEAVTNSGQAAQGVFQTIAGPGWFEYCFSIYMRSDAPSTVTLVRRNSKSQARTAAAVTSQWTRFTSSGKLQAADYGVTFGLELPAAASVEAFGAQVEAQPSAGPYKRTLDRGGVYPKTRFDQDALTQTADADEQHSTTVRISSNY